MIKMPGGGAGGGCGRPENHDRPSGRGSLPGRKARTRAVNILAITCLALLALTATVIARTVSEAQNRVFFRNLAESALQRSEQIIDEVSTSLAALAGRSTVGCNDMTLALLRTEIQNHGAVHDFRIVDGNGRTLCSSRSAAPPPSSQDFDLTGGLHSHDGQIRLVALGRRHQTALGVVRSLGADRGLVAVVRTDTLTDNLPPVSLRRGDETRVRLNDGAVIASYAEVQAPAEGQPALQRRSIAFRAASRRYPLQAEISVDGALLTHWSSQVRSAYGVRAGL